MKNVKLAELNKKTVNAFLITQALRYFNRKQIFIL